MSMRVQTRLFSVLSFVAASCCMTLVPPSDNWGRYSAAASSSLAKEPGWELIPDTQLSTACPDVDQIRGVEGCQAVIADWNGGLADTKRNRLILWGGGHSGYFGNEMYALDVEKSTLQRITEPTTGENLSNLKSCPEEYGDGKPNARHTYNGLQYISKLDQYFVFGAGLSPCGNFSNGVWFFNPALLTWTKQNPKTHPNPAQNGSVPMTAYDSGSGMVYEVEGNTGVFWKYDPSADNWTSLAEVKACAKLNMTSTVDPARKLYFCIGNGSFSKIGLSGSHKATTLAGRGCEGLISAGGPGFDFDSSQNRLVGWAGGATIYIYDPDSDSCTTKSFLGDPGPQQKNGTFGRFRYFPALNLFAVVNDWKQDAYVLRLGTPGSSNH
jgi:hypothetical protein